MMEQIVPGLVDEQIIVGSASDTAQHLGSGVAKTGASPGLILLLESTAVAAIQPYLPVGYQTVGVHSRELGASYENNADARHRASDHPAIYHG